MVRCYEGNLGMGKTLNAVYDLMQKIKRGYRVVSNTPVQFCTSNRPIKEGIHEFYKECKYKKKHLQAEYYPDAKQFFKVMLGMSSGIIFVDEAGILFNRKFAKFPVQFLIKAVQSRKQGLNFYYTAQSFNMLDGLFKIITNEVVQCRKFNAFGVSKLPRLRLKRPYIQWVDGRVFTGRVVDPILCIKRLSTSKRGTGMRYVKYTRKLYPRQYIPAMRAYDTLKLVNMNPIGYRERSDKAKKSEASNAFYGDKNSEFVLRPVN